MPDTHLEKGTWKQPKRQHIKREREKKKGGFQCRQWENSLTKIYLKFNSLRARI